MIIVDIKGGLGNQMFQYACGRALSLLAEARGEDSTLKLDITGYGRTAGSETLRTYDLAAFNVQAGIASAREIARLKHPSGLLSRAWRFLDEKVLRRSYVRFHPSVLDRVGDIYLDGYFQSEKYFKDFETEIRADFSLARPLGEKAKELLDKISRDPYAVSLHVRRGDYVSDKATNEHHGSCGIDYYERAVGEITARIGRASVYVFSDDIGWAKANMTFSCPVFFVSGQGVSSVEEIVLMSACRHAVIANSTFSWWGAWLNRNPDKIVIAPKRWSTRHNDDWYADIVGSTWIRI